MCLVLGHGHGLAGKTATTLAAINELIYDRLEVRKVLVIAPLRVASHTWATESQKWDNLKHIRISKILGTQKQRMAALEADADVYITNRENVVWLTETVQGWMFDMVVIDELSSFKNPAARRFRALRRKLGRIKRIVGLTGTPAPNGIADLWSQLYLLDRGERLGKTLSSFRAQYLAPEKMNGHIVYSYRPREGAQEAIHAKISDICMSLEKNDYLDLPGQIYEDVELAMPPALLKKYRKFERDRIMEALDGGDVVALNAASLTGKLLQFANGAIYDEARGVHALHDIKLDALEELIEVAGGENVLAFYAYQHDRDRIKARIDCRELRSEKDIDDWNAGKIHVALAHPASVGHGLNLQEGGHIIIWFGLPWSLELYQQANERLNRPGQKNVCRIYHLLLKGTADEMVLDALKRKDTSQRALIEALKKRV